MNVSLVSYAIRVLLKCSAISNRSLFTTPKSFASTLNQVGIIHFVLVRVENTERTAANFVALFGAGESRDSPAAIVPVCNVQNIQSSSFWRAAAPIRPVRRPELMGTWGGARNDDYIEIGAGSHKRSGGAATKRREATRPSTRCGRGGETLAVPSKSTES